jgi:hypothetical protein
MRTLTKSALVAATAATLLTSTAAMAGRSDWRGHRDGIDAGDVIAGALIIGGIAAIASVASNDRSDRGYGYRDRDYRYNGHSNWRGGHSDYGYYEGGYGSRMAVDQCVRAASNEARRYGGWARVTDVTRIDRIRGGYEIRGRVVVQDRNANGWRGNRNWDRGNRYDSYNDGYDRGRFSCITQRGNVRDVALSGLRGGWNRY